MCFCILFPLLQELKAVFKIYDQDSAVVSLGTTVNAAKVPLQQRAAALRSGETL